MGKQINQYSKTRTFADLTDEDLFDVDSTDDAGTSWESAKLTVLNLIRYINNNAKTYYNENGSINEDREVSMNTFNAKWIGGNIVAQMSDAINDYGFIVNDDALVEKARLGYDQATSSSVLSLFNSTGLFFNLKNGLLQLNNSITGGGGVMHVKTDGVASTTDIATFYGNNVDNNKGKIILSNDQYCAWLQLYDDAGNPDIAFRTINTGSSYIKSGFAIGTDTYFTETQVSVKGYGTGTTKGLQVWNSSDERNLIVFDNGRVVVGRDVSGSFDYGVHLKSFDLTNFVTIEDSAGNDYYNFNAGSMFIRSSGNIAAIKMGGLISADSIEARGRYTGVHDWEIYNPVAATIIARIRAASNVAGTTAGGIVHLDMANNGGVKIGGNATYDPLNKLDIRNASNNRMLVIEEADRITSVWGSGIAAATIPLRTKRSNGTLMGYIGSDASGHGYLAVADVGGVEKSRIVAEGESNINGDLNVDGDYKVNGNTGFTGTGVYTNFTIEGGIITAAS